MNPKGEVEYIAIKQRKPLWITIILTLIFFIILQVIITIKCIIGSISLYQENEDLQKVIQMKDSMISDIQEDNINLQEMIKQWKKI